MTSYDFTATDAVKCHVCAGPTIAPYTDSNGEKFEGYYCDEDGALTAPDGTPFVFRPAR